MEYSNRFAGNWTHLLWALVPTAAIGLVAGWATANQSWAALGVPTMSPNFADLRQATATAGCAADASWTIDSPGCDPFNRPYNLPSFWARGLALLGVTENSTVAIGIAFVVIFVLCIGIIAAMALSGRRPLTIVILLTISAVSPPVFLLLERGNVDVGIFLLVVASAFLYFLRAHMASGVSLAIAILLKLFPLGAALMLLVDRPRRLVLITFSVLLVIVMTLLAPELASIAARTSYGIAKSFGIAVVPRWLHLGSFTQARVVGLSWFFLTLAFIAAVTLWSSGPISSSWSRLSAAISADRTASLLVLVGGGCTVFAYLAGASWDYRLVFLIPLIAGLARIGWKSTRLAIPLAIVFVAQLWMTYPTKSWQYTSDFAWLLLAPLLMLLVLHVAGFLALGIAVPKDRATMSEPSEGK